MTTTEPQLRSPSITYQELLDADTHRVREVLRLQSPGRGSRIIRR